MLLPGREPFYTRFIEEYQGIRRREGRGSTNPEYYRTLPYHPSDDWRIRAKTFDVFVKKVLGPVENLRVPLRILDLGAGSGWLSNRLSGRGYEVAAVDLMVNDFDGLGCVRFYRTEFMAIQAEFDHLPFPDESADMVVFNASLHYSVGYETTLSESMRVLAPGGKIVILDSPVYGNSASGVQMVREREAQFELKYGFPSNSLPSENYLTWSRLQELAAGFGMEQEWITPFYGLRWMARPWVARALRRREPAGFHLIILKRKG